MQRSLPSFADQLAAARAKPLPSAITALRGRIGDMVYKTYRRPRGRVRIVVTRVADFTGYTPTSAQRTQRERMRAATAYAQRVYADPSAKALYVAAAQKLGRSPFRLAISDYLAGRVKDLRSHAACPASVERAVRVAGPTGGRPRVPETDLVSTQSPPSAQREESRSSPPVGARLDRARRARARIKRAPTTPVAIEPRPRRPTSHARRHTRHSRRYVQADSRIGRPSRPVESRSYYYTDFLFYIIALRRCDGSRSQSCLPAYSLSPPVTQHAGVR